MRGIAGGGVTVAIFMLCASPAGAGAKATVLPSTVGGATNVPAGGARSLTLTCPGTAVALHAAPVRLPSGVRVTNSGPSDDVRRWTLRFGSVARASRRVSATLRCVRLDLPNGVTDVTVRVSTDNRPSVRVAAGSTVNLSLRCPSGYIPTGQGVGVSTRAVKLVAAVPNGRGWAFRVENNGGSMARANASIRCLQRVASGRRGGARTRLAFGVKRMAYNGQVRSGKSRSISGTCARGRFSVSTGLSLDPGDDISLLRSYPFDSRDAKWFFSHRGAPEPVTSYLLCLSRSSRFR